MSFKRMLLVIGTMAVSALSACSPESLEGGDAPLTDVPAEAASFASPPELCPVGDVTCGTCSPIRDHGCEPCDENNPLHWCYVEPPPPPPCTLADGLISQYRVHRTGQGPNETPEVQIFAGSECNRWVVTGIGGSIVSDSNYEQLLIQYRELYSDGSMGPRMLYRTGSNAYRTPEAWVEAGEGYAFVGVAAGQQGTHDLRTLIGYARQAVVTPLGVRMSGPKMPLRGGVNPLGPLDSLAFNETAFDDEVFIGLGLRSAVEQTKTLVSYIGKLP